MIILLHGLDTYRSKQKLKEIVGEYKKRHQSGLNFIKIDFKEKDFSDFKQTVETVSMFDEKKLIIVEEIFQQSEYLQEELLDYLKKRKISSDKDLIVVFWAEKIDLKDKLFQFLKKKAKVQELAKYKLEYERAINENEKEALAFTIRHKFADYNDIKLDYQLRMFLTEIRGY